MPKKLVYPTEDLPLNETQTLCWTRLRRVGHYWKVPLVCRLHKNERLLPASLVMQPGFKQRCLKCLRQNPPWQTTGELKFPLGTDVLFDERADGAVHYVAIRCRGCFDPEKPALKYVHYQAVA